MQDECMTGLFSRGMKAKWLNLRIHSGMDIVCSGSGKASELELSNLNLIQ